MPERTCVAVHAHVVLAHDVVATAGHDLATTTRGLGVLLSAGRARPVLRRLTDDSAIDRYPLWTGDTVTFQSNRGGQVDLWEIDPATLRTRLLTSSEGEERPESATADGSLMSYQVARETSRLWRRAPSGRAVPLVSDSLGDYAPAASPDGQGALERDYGPSTGKGNLARFQLKAFDAIYERMKALPDGPERLALFDDATKLIVAYMPYRIGVHRILTDLSDASLVGYRRPAFWLDWWQYVDIDTEKLKKP